MADDAMTGADIDLRKWRLPRGRHGLPRELVVRSQRERLLAAVVRVTAAKGYEATTVGDILGEAGVGRESFYELFDDKRDCMLAAHTILVNHLEARVRVAYAGKGAWVDRVREALTAALDWFAADSDTARFALIELSAVGPASRRRFRVEFNRFVDLLEEGLDPTGPEPEMSRATTLAVGAALAKIYEEVALGRSAGLPALLPELTYEVLVPFIGEERARAERVRAEADSA
jgi:AcrR family transcriptional regulator